MEYLSFPVIPGGLGVGGEMRGGRGGRRGEGGGREGKVRVAGRREGERWRNRGGEEGQRVCKYQDQLSRQGQGL